MENNNKIIFAPEEKSLDEWVNETLAPIANMIYFISSSINRFMDSLGIDRG